MQQHISRRTYTVVFAALMVLLIVSVWVAQFDLGVWNVVVALGISVAKAILIMLYFMHIIYSSALTRVIAVAGLLWLSLMLALTFSDYQTRPQDMPLEYFAAPLDEPETGH